MTIDLLQWYLLHDPAAAYYLVFLVEDGGLAGGDGALGFVEGGVDEVFAGAGEGGRRGCGGGGF